MFYFINEETTNRDESFVRSYTATKCQCQHLGGKKGLFHKRVCPFNCCATYVLFTKRNQEKCSENQAERKLLRISTIHRGFITTFKAN